MAKQKKWYVVTVGRDVGVFKTWIEVSPLVTGVSGALHESFPSEAEAEEIFAEALTKGHVRVVGRTTTTPSVASPPQPSPSPQLCTRTPGPINSDRPHEYSPSRRPVATPRVASRNSHSERSSTSDLPTSVKSEDFEGTYQISSSPPTGVTQVVSLSSSAESAVLSPLVLRENELGSDSGSEQPTQNASSSRASSDSRSPRRVAASDSAQSSSNHNSLRPTTINVVHIHHHIHHAPRNSSGLDVHGEGDMALLRQTEEDLNLDSLSAQIAAIDLGLSQENCVSHAVDPRSPLRRPGLAPSIHSLASRRPSPRMAGESTLFSR